MKRRALPAVVTTAMCLAAACGSSRPAEAPRRGPEDLPVVLAHGLSGFRTLSGVDYFFRVPDALRADGQRVLATHVPPWSSVETRAQHLAEQVDAFLRRTGAPRVHIIAHSMGGLDARYMVTHLGRAPVVASITTIGTPHRGTPVADNYDAINLPPTHPLQDLAADFFIWTLGGIKVHSNTAGAVQDLSVKGMAAFNARTPDAPGVRYYSYAGRTLGHDGRGHCEDGLRPNPRELDLVSPSLFSTAVFLSGLDVTRPVANDGLVTVPSARWGLFMGCLPADHMRLVGQPLLLPMPGRWDHRAFYVEWARELTTGRALALQGPSSSG